MRKQLVYLDFCTGQIVCYCLLVKQYDLLLAIMHWSVYITYWWYRFSKIFSSFSVDLVIHLSVPSFVDEIGDMPCNVVLHGS